MEQPTRLTQQLRAMLTKDGVFPSRRRWERRLVALPESLPGLIGYLGQHLVSLLNPWQHSGSAVTLDSTPLRAKGSVWHKKHRDQGRVPHSTIDTEAHWSMSGYHGCRYGWKLHLACAVASVWIPLAAELTVANTDGASTAPDLLAQLPVEVRYILGDIHYNTLELRRICQQQGRWLIATVSTHG